MAVITRRNCRSRKFPGEMRDRYVEAVLEMNRLDLYEPFVRTHRNGNIPSLAHDNIAFLAWHRIFLWHFEQELRRVDATLRGSTTPDPEFALPYWDWTVDQSTLPDEETGSIWTDEFMGNVSTAAPAPGVTARPATGLFSDPATFTLVDITTLNRELGSTWTQLPSSREVELTLGLTTFDTPSFGADTTVTTPPSFRRVSEGFIRPPNYQGEWSQLHNGVHGWVGGAMGNASISPNDPVFWLHHANVDRLWASWQRLQSGPLRDHYPTAAAINTAKASNPFAPLIDEDLEPWTGGTTGFSTEDVLDTRNIKASGNGYEYDRYYTL